MANTHRRGDPRIDGGTTIAGPVDTSNVLIEGMPASVMGDLSSHNNLGAILSMSPGTVLVKGVPIAISLMDSAAPDTIGLITHPQGLPTPAGGSTTVQAYGPAGTLGGGLGNFGGNIGIGEIMQVGSQVMGQVMRTASTGGTGGMMVMNNMTSQSGMGVNTTVTSANSGNTFTFSSYYSS